MIKDPIELAPSPLDKDIIKLMQNGLKEKYSAQLDAHESITVRASSGKDSVFLQVEVGDQQKAHAFDFFIEKCEDPDDAIWDLLDFSDGVLGEFFAAERDAWLELDFSERTFENRHLLVRHDFKNFAAEDAAQKYLDKKSKI